MTVTAVQLYFVRHDFKFKDIIKNAKNYIISSVTMLICCLILGCFLSNGMASLFIIVVVGIVVYGVLLILLKDEFVFEILKKIKNKLNGV